MTREEIIKGLQAGNVLYQDVSRPAVREQAFMASLVRAGYVEADLVRDRYGRVLRRYRWKQPKRYALVRVVQETWYGARVSYVWVEIE